MTARSARLARLLRLCLLAWLPACGGLVAPSVEAREGGPAPVASADAGAPTSAPDAAATDATAPRDASEPDAPDASGECACTDELVQVEGTCEFEVEDRGIACVLDRTEGGPPVSLDLFRSCIVDAPPSWTPGLLPTRIEQCDCTPGQARRLCVAYR